MTNSINSKQFDLTTLTDQDYKGIIIAIQENMDLGIEACDHAGCRNIIDVDDGLICEDCDQIFCNDHKDKIIIFEEDENSLCSSLCKNCIKKNIDSINE